MASVRWSGVIVGLSAMSAMVLETFRQDETALGEKPYRKIALSRTFLQSPFSWQKSAIC